MNQLHTTTARIACSILILLSSLLCNAQTNYAVNFDGTDDYVALPATVAVSQLNTFTIEAWVYWNGIGNACIYSETVQGNDLPMLSISPRAADGGGIELVLRDNSATGLVLQPATAIITANRWVHVAIVRTSSTNIKTYIDGVLKDNASFTTPAAWTPNKVNLGIRWRSSQDGPFGGKIDEVRIWNTARTQAEIKANMFNKNFSNGASGLVGYYRVNDGSGTTAVNSCTNTSSIDGTLTNGPTWVSSPVQYAANALSFDGTNDYVGIPDDNTLDITTAITLEAWVYATKNSGIQNVMSKSSNSTNNGYIFPRTDDGWAHAVFYLHVSGGWQTLSAVYPSLNAWHHLAATYDGTTMKLYIDGTLAASKAQTGTITTNANPLALGNQTGFSEFFGGSGDEFRVWNVARTQTQIQNSMNTELDPASQTGLVSYYTVNQGIAGGTNTGLTTLIDQAGSNNGTLTNFSLTGATSNFVTQNSSMFVLPLKWISFTAQKQKDGVLLQWNTTTQINTKDFIVEQKSNTDDWKDIVTVPSANGTNDYVNHYSYTHATPSFGMNYYRIKQTDIDGKFSYSEVRSVRMDEAVKPFRVIANPAICKVLQIQVNDPNGELICLYNSAGSLVWKKQFPAGSQTIHIHQPTSGVYILSNGVYWEKILIR